MTVQNPNRQQLEAKIIARAMEDGSFKQELLNNPDAAREEVEKELGQKLSEDFKIRVVQETENLAYIVLPATPAANEELSEEQLQAVAGGHTIQLPCMLFSLCITTEDGAGC